MAFKLMVGVICVRRGLVVKSYGYNFWRPAGSISTALKNLDRWGADEILVLDISRSGHPDPAVLDEIYRARIQTPLVYGGGIRKLDDVKRLLQVGCDRFVVESVVFESPSVLDDLAAYAGVQAIIGCLPLTKTDRGWQTRCAHRSGAEMLSLDKAVDLLKGLPISEVVVVDADDEGFNGAFGLPVESGLWGRLNKGVIWFGGINEEIAHRLLTFEHTVAAAFGNINFEREIALHTLRRQLAKKVPTLRSVRL
jgi:cyclase